MSRSKLLVYSFLTLSLAFGIGYFRGAKPEAWRKLLGTKQGHFVILLGGEDILPLKTIQNFERATGSTVEIRFAGQPQIFNQEILKADLLFAPLDWLGAIENHLTPFPNFPELSKLVASDFQSMQLLPHMFLPVLWRTVTQEKPPEVHLQIWGFATAKDEGDLPDAAQLLVKKLMDDPENIKAWAHQVAFNMTMEKTNSLKEFPGDKSASRVRELNLTNLKIDRKL